MNIPTDSPLQLDSIYNYKNKPTIEKRFYCGFICF